jgi:meiosis-specific protein HOP1
MLCYGFIDPNDPNMPSEHCCYRCLLEPNDKNLLKEMETTVLMRRALNIISEEGYPNKAATLAEKMRK